MSVVSPTSRIPGYDLTISAGGEVPYPVAMGKVSTSAWWGALNDAFGRHDPLAALVRRSDGNVLLALSDTYLEMVQSELIQLSDQQREKLRIILAQGSRLSPALEPQAIRYDQRFQRLKDAPSGALASFSQRALLHLSGLLVEHPHVHCVNEQRRLVEAALGDVEVEIRNTGKSRTDEQIRIWIAKADPAKTLSRSALLAQLRARGWACEQSRFSRLVAESGK